MVNKFIKVFICIILFLYVSEISEFGIPQFLTFFSILSAFYLTTIGLGKIFHFFNLKAFMILFVILFLFALMNFKDYMFGEIKIYQMIARVLQPMVFFFLFYQFAVKSFNNALFLTRMFGLFLITSFLVLLLAAYDLEKFLSLKYLLYDQFYEKLLAETKIIPPQLLISGLTPSAYIFGYQIACGSILFAGLFWVENGYWKAVWGFSFLISLMMLVVSAERSLIPAIVGGLLCLFSFFLLQNISSRKIIIFNGLLLLVVAFISILFFVTDNNKFSSFEFSGSSADLMIERFNKTDFKTRLGMQMAAISIGIEKPFGLFVDGLREEEWGNIAEKKGFEVVSDANGDFALVHNGYLRYFLYFGWMAGLLIVYVLLKIYRMIKQLYHEHSKHKDKSLSYASVASCALVAVIIQALFHNASLFTIERSTWMIFILFISWLTIKSREIKSEKK